jgi:hypothetical protein
MRLRTRPARSKLIPIGQVLLTVGVIFLVYLVLLMVLFGLTSRTVAADEVYAWESGHVAFVQPAGDPPACVLRTHDGAARVSFQRPSSALIPGELVDRPAGDGITLVCDQPVRLATGLSADLYETSGPAFSLYVFGLVALAGLGLWVVGWRRSR